MSAVSILETIVWISNHLVFLVNNITQGSTFKDLPIFAFQIVFSSWKLGCEAMASQKSQTEVTVPDRFNKPFYKLALPQLTKARKERGEWVVGLEGGRGAVLALHMVWLQGVVQGLDRDRGSLELEEDGVRVKVVGLSGVPGAGEGVEVGNYVQVIGQVQGLEGGQVKVEAKVVRDLTSCKVARQLWPLEVRELHNLLSEQSTIIQ